MKRTELNNLQLGTLVKRTPQGKIYKVVMSNKSNYRATLEDVKTNKTIEVSPFMSVYYEVTK